MNKKKYLIGYRMDGVKTYRTNLKPLGYVVAGVGFVSLGVALIPDALILLVYPKAFLIGLIAYPLGFALLGAIGIKVNIKKKIVYKLRLFRMRRGLL